MAFKNSPISLSKAPPPDTKAFKFPPNCFFTFFLTKTFTIEFVSFSEKIHFFF